MLQAKKSAIEASILTASKNKAYQEKKEAERVAEKEKQAAEDAKKATKSVVSSAKKQKESSSKVRSMHREHFIFLLATHHLFSRVLKARRIPIPKKVVKVLR